MGDADEIDVEGVDLPYVWEASDLWIERPELLARLRRRLGR